MKQTCATILCLLAIAFGATAETIPSWLLPPEDEWNGNWENIPNEPDCSYSFVKDGIYYWISDEDAGTAMVVNRHPFFARRYCYYQIVGYWYISDDFDAYDAESIDIPATVEHNGRTYTVTTIGYEAFCGSDNLTTVRIPDTVTEIWGAAFFNCPKLRRVELSPNVKTIWDGTFQACPSLEFIDLSNTDYVYWWLCFRPGTGLGLPDTPTPLKSVVLPTNPGQILDALPLYGMTTLWQNNPEPPQTQIFFEERVYSEATLYVPAASLDKYRNDTQWGRFSQILPDNTAIDNITVDNASSADKRVYNLAGVCVASDPEAARDLAPGVYISAGRKFMVR